ncbi:uncharacterized protein V1516DRAFT_695707 [Lipomyces oligophaga]|uniref:uncharacterized protein n=1 Tax=Lipomyces oligophaga TaxID=45792 RepID=UPI0034CE56F3
MDSESWQSILARRFRSLTTIAYNENLLALERTPVAFVQEIKSLSQVPMEYENSDLLDEALDIMPLAALYEQAEAAVLQDPSWSMQDHLIRALLKWFRNDLFEWVNSPKCEICGADSRPKGPTAPTHGEQQDGAGRVELFECTSCGAAIRFPRYSKPRRLLTYRKGRCGEWANCFALLCRALGSTTRWIWNAEDHVWVEVYSTAQKRWIHADPCETAWDNPRLYEQGWGKKMSYVLAFSADGARDVSWRYIRNPRLPRNRISEVQLGLVLKSITTKRRELISPAERTSLEQIDIAETCELANTILIDDSGLASMSLSALTMNQPRQSGAGSWTRSRGEDGRT